MSKYRAGSKSCSLVPCKGEDEQSLAPSHAPSTTPTTAPSTQPTAAPGAPPTEVPSAPPTAGLPTEAPIDCTKCTEQCLAPSYAPNVLSFAQRAHTQRGKLIRIQTSC